MWYALTYWKAWTRCYWEADMHMTETRCPLSMYKRRELKLSYDPVEMRLLRFNLSLIGRDNIWVMILMKSRFFRMPKCSSVFGETMQWWADTYVILLHTVSMQKSIFNFVWGKMKGVTWSELCKIVAALSYELCTSMWWKTGDNHTISCFHHSRGGFYNDLHSFPGG